MIIAGCTASVVSVPARGIRLLLSLPVFGCLLLLLLCLFVVFFDSLHSLFSLFSVYLAVHWHCQCHCCHCSCRFLFACAVFFISLYSAIFCCCFYFYFYYFYLIAFSHVAVVVAVGGAYHFRCCLNCFTDFLLLSLSLHMRCVFLFFIVFSAFLWCLHYDVMTGHLLSLVIDRKSAVCSRVSHMAKAIEFDPQFGGALSRLIWSKHNVW